MPTPASDTKTTDDLANDVGTAVARHSRLVNWPVGLGFALLAGLIVWYLRRAVPQFLSYDAGRYGAHLWERRLVFLPHFISAATALFLGLTQMWLGLSGRHWRLHRILGRLYLVTVACGCAGGCILAAMIMSQALVFASGFFFMGCAWAMTTALAFLAIRRRAVAVHREWMMRSYVIALAFVSFRVFGKLMQLTSLGSPEQRPAALAWISWVVPLLAFEFFVQLGKLRSRKLTVPRPAGERRQEQTAL